MPTQAKVEEVARLTEKFSKATHRTVPLIREVMVNELLDEIEGLEAEGGWATDPNPAS